MEYTRILFPEALKVETFLQTKLAMSDISFLVFHFIGPESCGIIKPPNAVSISYSQNEVTITAASATRQCNEYGKLGLLGTSIFYSSGDTGVAGNGNVCLTATGEQSSNGTRFNPKFPSTCPFVTSVGATQVNPGSTVNDPEGACEQVIFSGGGFSNVRVDLILFLIPSQH